MLQRAGRRGAVHPPPARPALRRRGAGITRAPSTSCCWATPRSCCRTSTRPPSARCAAAGARGAGGGREAGQRGRAHCCSGQRASTQGREASPKRRTCRAAGLHRLPQAAHPDLRAWRAARLSAALEGTQAPAPMCLPGGLAACWSDVQGCELVHSLRAASMCSRLGCRARARLPGRRACTCAPPTRAASWTSCAPTPSRTSGWVGGRVGGCCVRRLCAFRACWCSRPSAGCNLCQRALPPPADAGQGQGQGRARRPASRQRSALVRRGQLRRGLGGPQPLLLPPPPH